MNFWLFIILSFLMFIGMSGIVEICKQLLNVEIEGRFWDRITYDVIGTAFHLCFFMLGFAMVFGEFK